MSCVRSCTCCVTGSREVEQSASLLFLSCFGPRPFYLTGSMASSALSIGGVTVKGPTAPSQPPEVVFKALAEAYELDVKVKDFLISSGVRTLAEFCSMFRNEDEVKTLGIDTIAELPQPLAQTARLREAWSACRKAKEASESTFRAADDADDDTPLGQEYLNDLDAKLWQRHKIRLAPHVNPGELLVSRICKQISRHHLKFQNLLKVHTEHQEGSALSRRRERLSEKLVLEQLTQQIPDSPRTTQAYLACMYTYAIALGKAGVNPLSTVPAEPESPTTDPVLYVQCPLDTVLEYHTRATKLANSIADPSTQLQWLMRLDEEERQLWTERYKLFKDRSLGSIIREVSKERAHLWVYHVPPGQGGRGGGGGRGDVVVVEVVVVVVVVE